MDRGVLPPELANLTLIPASKLVKSDEVIPARAGVYLFFLKGGASLLEAADYFALDGRTPLSRGKALHVYTGAADNLRRRMVQHLRRDYRGSTFRKTLLSIEHARDAISAGRNPVRDDADLTTWLFEHLLIGIELSRTPFDREQQLIEHYGSPLNISYQRKHLYSRRLMEWRQAAFPRWQP